MNWVIGFGTVVFAGLTYLLGRKVYSTSNGLRRKENAVKIAERYVHIIGKFGYVHDISRELKQDIVKKVREFLKDNKCLRFSQSEYEKIFSSTDNPMHVVERMLRLRENHILLLKVYMRNHEHTIDLRKTIKGLEAKSKVNPSYTLDPHEEYEIDRAISKYYEAVTSVMNEFESICMSFNQNIADEDVVFNSLHQTFRQYVCLLYPVIAYRNNSDADKYYTNIIRMYNRWEIKYQKKCLKEKLGNDRCEKAITRMEVKLQRIKARNEAKLNKTGQLKP